MTFVGVETISKVRWFSTARTSSDNVDLSQYPTAVAVGTIGFTVIRLSNLNPDDAYQAQKTRMRGLAIYPISEGDGAAEDETWSFQLVGWMLGARKAPPLAGFEYRPIALWTGTVTLGNRTSDQWGGEDDVIRFAKNLAETSPMPESIQALAGASPIIHNRGSSGFDQSDSMIIIPDLSHLFWGFTLRTNLSSGGGTAAPNANFLIQFIF